MLIQLKRAEVSDAEKIHCMQVAGFKALLDKYRDFETSPGAETLERVKIRFENPQIDHYFINLNDESIGYLRVNRLEANTCRLSQLFVLPEYQANGYAQQAIRQVELLYPQASKWTLDTIKQEQKLCYLYEKMGYRQTGLVTNIKDGMDLVDYIK